MAAIDEAVIKEAIKRDIDGLPLKDNQRVDLKTILGHSPPVDDDDPEAEGSGQRSLRLEDFTIEENNVDDDDDDDGIDEDANNCLALRQRRSSLRTQQQQQSGDRPPDSPTGERKGVRFADSLGLGLAAIRDVGDDDEPPEIPHSALNALRIRRRRGQAQRGKVMVLVPAFETPDAAAAATDQGFLDRVAARNVLLESCFVCSRELTVSGVVRVKNFAYEKTVVVRYTTDGWSTHRDVPANYVPNSNDGRTDRFVFIVHLPEGFGAEEEEEEEAEEKEDTSSADSGSVGRSLQLAVALHAGGDTFWDNNDGENYVIDCVMRNREPSISGESAKTTTTSDAVGQ